MSETTTAAVATDNTLTAEECETLLRRTCFGHLAFVRSDHADVLPVRFAFVDRWVYFRADAALRSVIAHNPWLVLSVTELRDVTHVSSVVVRGGCYVTERSGSTADDAAALRGIIELRDRPAVGRERAPRVERSSIVFRLHVDELRGTTTFVPCPAGARAYDLVELQHLREAGLDHTIAEDERADDDGMAEPNSPIPPRSVR